MSQPPGTPRRAALPVLPSDVRGLSRLGVDAVLGMTDVVEAMHHAITARAGIVGPAPAGRPGGITGLVYGAVRGTTRLVGRGLDLSLGALTRLAEAPAASTPGREALLAALNGLWGDHLADSGNPLAIEMSLRVQGRALDLAMPLAGQLPGATGRLLVLVHGLCMNDLQWQRQGHDHGRVLAAERGYTPVYLHYNSGRHISDNGRDVAHQLDQLVGHWPVPLQELVIIGHSMGGLVARSACHQARLARQPWLGRLQSLVCLGTPHHGAPLERGGQLVDRVLGVSPYAAPLARIGKTRSAGITDLRFGNLQQADWEPGGRHAQQRDQRVPTPLPDGVAVFLVAGTLGAQAGDLRSATIGDGLVPLASALGRHPDPALRLAVPPERQLIVAEANHWDLLNRPEVARQLLAWL